jgi:hypothetical protein
MQNALHGRSIAGLDVAKSTAMVESKGKAVQHTDNLRLRYDITHSLQLPVINIRAVRKIPLCHVHQRGCEDVCMPFVSWSFLFS